jgi:hypothetical protein
MNSAGLGDPGGWNRYAYTRGDPVNRKDPRGRCDQSADTDKSVTVCGDDDDSGDDGGDQDIGGATASGSSGSSAEQQQQPPTLAQLEQTSLNVAQTYAWNALLNSKCADLFADGVGENPRPGIMLNNLISMGNVIFANLNPAGPLNINGDIAGTNAQTGQIIINWAQSSESGWFSNTLSASARAAWDAVILLHELGHYYDEVLGADTAFVNDSTSDAANMNNTNLILINCFPGMTWPNGAVPTLPNQ